MNWPPLSEGLTSALSDVLEQAYRQKPAGGLLEFVAAELQERSGKDPAAYQGEFEQACKVVRTYQLEDECPPEADPFAWIRKRYNDEAILSFLRARGGEAARQAKAGGDVMAELPKYVPELAYLRDNPEKKRWLDTFLKVMLALVRQSVSTASDHPAAPLVLAARAVLEAGGPGGAAEVDFEEALAVGLVRVLQDLPGVEKHRAAGVLSTRFSAFEAAQGQYPTIFRHSPEFLERLRTVSGLPDVLAPMLHGELLPAQLVKLKEAGGLPQLVAYQTGIFLADQAVDAAPGGEREVAAAARVATAVADAATKTVHVINSQFLEKTAKDAEFPFTIGAGAQAGGVDRNPLQCRAVLRLSLLTSLALEPKGCFQVEEVFEELSQSEKQVLQRELCKDGVLQHPACQLNGARKWMTAAAQRGQLLNAMQLLAAVMQEVLSEASGAGLREPNITIDMRALIPVAEALGPDAATIDTTAVTVERSGNVFALQAHRI